MLLVSVPRQANSLGALAQGDDYSVVGLNYVVLLLQRNIVVDEHETVLVVVLMANTLTNLVITRTD